MAENKYIKNIDCPKCGHSDSVGIYEREDGSTFGKCFHIDCEEGGGYIDNPDGEENTKSKRAKMIYPPINMAGLHPLLTRGISKETCEKYGVLSIVNESGIDTYHYYPHTNESKISCHAIRQVSPKDFSWMGSPKSIEFFGQNIAGDGGKMILVTEGACDAMAVSEMLAKCGKNYRCVSITSGSSSASSDFKNNYEWISKFESIFLALDQDDAGQKAVSKIADLFPPNKVKNLKFSEKDPNAMLLANKHNEFLQSIFSAKESKPDGIVGVDELYDEAITPPVQGFSFPWPSLTEVTYGYRFGELWGIGAGSGTGKTEFFKECIHHTINVHNRKAGVIFLEEPAAKTLKVLAGKKVNKRFHIPSDKGGDWTVEELIDGINDLKGKVYLYNHFGSKDWESIKPKIRYMVSALGIKEIYLDHLTALVAQEDNEYKALNRLMEEMSSLCQELDCVIFYVSHLRKASGTPHEEGGRVTADQFKGSGAIVFWSNFLIGLERDQQAADEEERNITTLRVLKDRNTGLATGHTFKLKYNHDTGRWGELDEDEFNEEFN
jgi:twinkle protein